MKPQNYQQRALAVLNRLSRIAAKDATPISTAITAVDPELATAMIADGLIDRATDLTQDTAHHISVRITAAGESLARIGGG